jgi:hypothetical protein
MMLRVSIQQDGGEVDLAGIVEGADSVDERIPAGRELAAFAEAVISDDDANLEQMRNDVIAAVGPDGFVDAAAVVGNFERMVRIADGIGIPLDKSAADMSVEIRDELGLNEFRTARFSG